MNFGQIPEEIILKIFSYFTIKEISKCLAPVCAQWWTISKDPSLRKRLELHISAKKSPNVYREVIARWEASLTSLTLITPILCDKLTTYFPDLKLPHLKELDIRGWRYIQHGELRNIVYDCANVEILSLRVGSFSGLHNIAKMKNLKSLTLSNHDSQYVHIPDMEFIVQLCAKLEALILRLQYTFDDKFLVHLAKYRKETLRHLVLRRKFLTDESVRAITSCHNLSTLCLKGIYLPLSGDMLMTLSTMQNLNWLNLGGAMNREPHRWSNFFKCPNLSSLTILELSGSGLDDNSAVSLAMTCKKLVILDVSHNFNLRNVGVQNVIDNCRELYYLDLAGTDVTGDILISIPSKLPKLKYLNVKLCSGIDETDLENFCLKCPRIEFTNDHVEYTVDKRLNLKCQS